MNLIDTTGCLYVNQMFVFYFQTFDIENSLHSHHAQYSNGSKNT